MWCDHGPARKFPTRIIILGDSWLLFQYTFGASDYSILHNPARSKQLTPYLYHLRSPLHQNSPLPLSPVSCNSSSMKVSTWLFGEFDLPFRLFAWISLRHPVSGVSFLPVMVTKSVLPVRLLKTLVVFLYFSPPYCHFSRVLLSPFTFDQL